MLGALQPHPAASLCALTLQPHSAPSPCSLSPCSLTLRPPPAGHAADADAAGQPHRRPRRGGLRQHARRRRGARARGISPNLTESRLTSPWPTHPKLHPPAASLTYTASATPLSGTPPQARPRPHPIPRTASLTTRPPGHLSAAAPQPTPRPSPLSEAAAARVRHSRLRATPTGTA